MTFQPFHSRRLTFAAMAMLLVLPVRADVLELINGDRYQGTVVAMNLKAVEFQSEVQGKVTLPREKVARITFHEIAAKPGVVPTGASNAVSKSAQAEVALGQLRSGEADSKMIKAVRDQVVGSGTPEAVQKFDDLYGGLLSGKLSLQDLRSEAKKALSDVKSAKAELGDDVGDYLDGYLAILEKFVQETTPAPAPAANSTPVVKPAPKK
jgi:hypothetical protein